MLAISTGYSKATLEEIIIKRLIDNDLINEKIECGWSIQHIAFHNGFHMIDIVDLLFPEGVNNSEVLELMDSIIIKNIITVEYWINTPDGYDNRYIDIETFDESIALENAINSPLTRRGKDFKIYKNL